MKPFNLQDAINGKPVITRAGDSLTFGAYIPQANGYKLFMLRPDGVVLRYNENGIYICNDIESPMDLFMAPTKRTVWVNLYGRELESVCHPTEEDADKHASPDRIGGKAYPLEIEE